MAELSPMMQQYLEIKNQHKDEILFYRIGDFYEMFFDDAVTASRELDLTLTGKQCGLAERAPMCGVPFHSYEGYVARLISKGYKVAICERVEDPAKGRRGPYQAGHHPCRVTPITVIESSMLPGRPPITTLPACTSRAKRRACALGRFHRYGTYHRTDGG